MRRFAFVLAMCGLLGSPSAMADPFDQLSSRLKQYDDSNSVTAQSPAPKRSAVVKQRSTADSGVAPEPVPHLSPEPDFHDNYAHDQPWDEPYYDEGCYDDGCDGCYDWGCGGCCSAFWGRAEYVHWWVRGSNTPPLVTTSPENTPQSSAGILPLATVLFGGERLNEAGRPGGRFTAGYWFDPCGCNGIESSTFFLGKVEEVFNASSGGVPILARPFFNVQTNTNDANLVAFPGIVIGTITAASSSRVAGTELNLRHGVYLDCWRRLDFIAGYRFFQLAEDLSVATNTTSVDSQSNIPVGTTFGIQDIFSTKNNFHGGQLGLNMNYMGACWSLDLLAKVALGGVSQHIGITGTTVVTVPDSQPASNSGGILALASNMGSYQRSRFSVLPEFGVTLRRQLSPCWRMNLGYTLLVVSNVVRPGDQIDTRLDPNLFPPPIASGTFPRFVFNDSDIWVQGINFGLECNF